MELESIMLSEISQAVRDKYHMINEWFFFCPYLVLRCQSYISVWHVPQLTTLIFPPRNVPQQITCPLNPIGIFYHSKICFFGIRIILSGRHFKNSKCRKKIFLTPLISLKTGLPKGTQLSYIPSLRKTQSSQTNLFINYYISHLFF